MGVILNFPCEARNIIAKLRVLQNIKRMQVPVLFVQLHLIMGEESRK